jgi:hypothetical protein
MRTLLKSLVFVLALVPLGWLAFTVSTGRSGPNPAEDIILTTGIWALRFLLITLAITPARRLTGVNVVIQYRRMLGLFAFFYACVHLQQARRTEGVGHRISDTEDGLDGTGRDGEGACGVHCEIAEGDLGILLVSGTGCVRVPPHEAPRGRHSSCSLQAH